MATRKRSATHIGLVTRYNYKGQPRTPYEERLIETTKMYVSETTYGNTGQYKKFKKDVDGTTSFYYKDNTTSPYDYGLSFSLDLTSVRPATPIDHYVYYMSLISSISEKIIWHEDKLAETKRRAAELEKVISSLENDREAAEAQSRKFAEMISNVDK